MVGVFCTVNCQIRIHIIEPSNIAMIIPIVIVFNMIILVIIMNILNVVFNVIGYRLMF